MNDNDNLFNWIGEKLGAVIRALVEGLAWLFGHLYAAFDSFLNGLTSSLGISSSSLSVGLLVIGLLLLYAAVRSLVRRAWGAGILWALLSLVLLSWLIH